MNTQKIRLTGDWTDPETGTAHKAGEVITVPDYYLRLENDNGLFGKYSCKLAPPQAARAAPSQPPPKATTAINDKE